ncbi:cytochrome-c oxidase, cbb3-type subunit II [Leucothrix arctica]|uniref:cytochrome-c oxidase, cbb3-type subunit II n=1 Tax=Leucothrix arctica TaxID=1481894 RepID=UPI001BA5CA25|nr:cytochrome-c oxidase, cbb3-type subunit II [Leucothrix arctica]
MKIKHEIFETNIGVLIVFTMLAISIGGLVEIAPLFYINDTVEDVRNADGTQSVRPYSGLEQHGRDIYTREGCYNCHSQMIRPFRDEALRYGHYSLAAESQYDHPFQWGSKRTGPDLARVGEKYSDAWHVKHLIAPRSVVPESVMPNYPWLQKNDLDYSQTQAKMRALKKVGVPYSSTQEEYEANVKQFGQAVADKLDITRADENLIAEAENNNRDGLPDRITEMDALVAYLQVLGTMIDFKAHDEHEFIKTR